MSCSAKGLCCEVCGDAENCKEKGVSRVAIAFWSFMLGVVATASMAFYFAGRGI